jgi:uncharacterized protein (TIGR03435 family)
MPPGGRLVATDVPLSFLIQFAYQLQSFQLLGVRDWIGSQHFHVSAQAPVGASLQSATSPQLQLMLRTVLEERFRLVLRKETRPLPIYALRLARSDRKLGPRLHPAVAACPEMFGRDGVDATLTRDASASPCRLRINAGSMAATGIPMSEVVRPLSQLAGRVVVDQTGLTGLYDFELSWTPDLLPRVGPAPNLAQALDPNGPSLFTALGEQLGLKLEATRGPVEVFVITNAERPTPD